MDLKNKKKAVFDHVLGMLSSGSYPAGSILPSGKELAQQFGLSRYHVHQALTEFYDRSLISSRKKGGISVLRDLFDYEKRHLRAFLSDKILIINHMPSNLPWSVVHINEDLFSTLYPPLENAGYQVIYEELSLADDLEHQINQVEQLIDRHTPSAVIIFAGGRIFEAFQNVYYRRHSKLFVFTRSGVLTKSPLWTSVGIADCADGMTAAEAAFSNGAERILFCYRSCVQVQYWQVERRKGVQLFLQMYQNGQAFVDDFHAAKNFPFTTPRPTTCLIAQNDELAAELVAAGRVHGLEPGRDYKLIGFGDDPRFRDLELTTLRPDFARISSELAEGVIRACQNTGKTVIESKLIPSLLVRRKTL